MRIIRKVIHRMHTLVRPRRFERDLDEELSFHLEMQTRWHESQGLDRQSAHALAAREFGGEPALTGVSVDTAHAVDRDLFDEGLLDHRLLGGGLGLTRGGHRLLLSSVRREWAETWWRLRARSGTHRGSMWSSPWSGNTARRVAAIARSTGSSASPSPASHAW